MSMLEEVSNAVPIWVKALTTVGFPILVAVFLLLQSAGWIPSEVQALSKLLVTREAIIDRHIKETDDLAISLRLAIKIMCENSAKNDNDRRNCLNIR